MYKPYLKQAWQLMKQNRFFSAVYIIGTGLAISMVMVMAVGSTRHGIQDLMIGEGLLLLTLAAIPALLVCVNLVYMDMLSTKVMPVSPMRFGLVTLLTWLVMAAIIFLATWYPSRKASRLEPAEALHYE